MLAWTLSSSLLKPLVHQESIIGSPSIEKSPYSVSPVCGEFRWLFHRAPVHPSTPWACCNVACAAQQASSFQCHQHRLSTTGLRRACTTSPRHQKNPGSGQRDIFKAPLLSPEGISIWDNKPRRSDLERDLILSGLFL